jgi:hypothetical protein
VSTNNGSPPVPNTREAGDPSRAARRVVTVLWNVVGALFVWLIIMAFVQGGWSLTWRALIAVVLLASLGGMLAGMGSRFLQRPLEIIAILMIYAALAWVYLAGSFESWRQFLWDAVGIAAGVALAVLIERVVRARVVGKIGTTSRLYDELRSVGYLLAAWIGVTLVTVLRPTPLPNDPARFASLDAAQSIVPTQAALWRDLRVGIALSGGGYRAAVFHSGTLHALETLGIRANTLSTVSGGSIIGAYYAIGGDPVAFKDAVAEGRFHLKEARRLRRSRGISRFLRIKDLGRAGVQQRPSTTHPIPSTWG